MNSKFSRKLNVLITSADLNLGGEQLSTIGLAEGLVDRGVHS